MAALMCVADDVEEIDNVELEGTSDIESVILHIAAETEGRGEKTYWLELDDGNVTDEVLHKLNLSAKFPVNFSRLLSG